MTQYTILPLAKTRPTHPRAFPGSGTRSSLAKAALVNALGFFLAWRPAIAIRLGKLVLRVWPNFRRA